MMKKSSAVFVVSESIRHAVAAFIVFEIEHEQLKGRGYYRTKAKLLEHIQELAQQLIDEVKK